MKHLSAQKRIKRIRGKIKGTGQRPRLTVFRSHRYIYAQLIDDEKRHTLASADSRKINTEEKSGKMVLAAETGKVLAQKAMAKKIKQAVFDRHGYKYHGLVKALAEGARSEGLEF